MDLFQYLDKHDFISFLFFVGVIPFVAWMFVSSVNSLFEFFSQLLRSVTIWAHGWPPEHVDANGEMIETSVVFDAEEEEEDDV